MDNAFDAYVGIANKYLERTGGTLSTGERVSPIDRQRLQPNPSPAERDVPRPYVPRPYVMTI